MSFNATHNIDGLVCSIADYLIAFRNVMKYISAVPSAVYLLLTRLFILGVVRWNDFRLLGQPEEAEKGVYSTPVLFVLKCFWIVV